MHERAWVQACVRLELGLLRDQSSIANVPEPSSASPHARCVTGQEPPYTCMGDVLHVTKVLPDSSSGDRSTFHHSRYGLLRKTRPPPKRGSYRKAGGL